MDENVIFNSSQPAQQPPATGTILPTTAPAVPTQPVAQAANNTSPTESPTPPPKDPVHGFPKLLLIGGIIGVVFILLILFFIIRLLLTPSLGVQNVTLTYWGLWEDSRTMQPLIDDFERQYPNIKITYIKQDIQQYRDRLMIRVGNGTGPDIFRFHNTWVPMLTDVLLPLPNSVIPPSEFQTAFYPVIQKDLVRNGAIYGIPLEIDTLELFVNTDILKAGGVNAPASWASFQDIAKQLTVKDQDGKIKTSGAALGVYENITHAPDILSLLFVQDGADLLNIYNSKGPIASALDYFLFFANSGTNTWDSTLDPSVLAFAKGNLAMFFGYSWDIPMIKALNPSLNYSIHPVPALVKDRSMTIASYWVEGVSNRSKYQKEALLFMHYLAQKETEQKLYAEESKTRIIGEPYARVDLANTMKDNPLIAPFLMGASTAVSSYFVGDTFDDGVNSHTNAYLASTVHSLINGGSSQTAANDLGIQIYKVLKQYGE